MLWSPTLSHQKPPQLHAFLVGVAVEALLSIDELHCPRPCAIMSSWAQTTSASAKGGMGSWV